MKVYPMDVERGARQHFVRSLAGVVAIMLVGALASCVVGCSPTPSATSSASSASGAEQSSAASDGVKAGEMKIKVEMSEAVTSPEAADSPLQFSEEQIDVVAPDGSTAIEVLKATGREIKTEGDGANENVVAIGGLANGDAGETSAWVYRVNDVDQSEAPGTCVLQDGDTLSFVFVDDAPVARASVS